MWAWAVKGWVFSSRKTGRCVREFLEFSSAGASVQRAHTEWQGIERTVPHSGWYREQGREAGNQIPADRRVNWMVSGLQVLMGTHWGQGTVAGAWLLQPFIWVVSRSLERSVYGSAG